MRAPAADLGPGREEQSGMPFTEAREDSESAQRAAWTGAGRGPVVRVKKFIRGGLLARTEERKEEGHALLKRQQIKTLSLALGCTSVPASPADLGRRG